VKKTAFFALSVLALSALAAVYAYAEDENSGTADLEAVYQNTNAFDGGDGSTINVKPAEIDAQNS
jgi:hypothetical protein